MNNLLCVGHSTYDITYLMNEFPTENKKYKIENTKMMGGGPTGNAAYLLGKYKENVSYITTLGTDIYGQEIIRELKSVNVDLSHSLIKNDYFTPCSMIITNTTLGSRTILNHRINNAIPPFYKLEYKKSPSFILFDGHELELAKLTLKEFPKAVTVLDAGSFKLSCVELGKEVDYLVSSEDFAQEFSKVDKITEENFSYVFKKLEELNKNNIVITLGEKGCLFKKDNLLYLHPAFPTKAIDTTGAGDIFHGAFLYALSKNFDFIDILKFSSVCASLSVEKIGGRNSIPELKDIFKRMEEWKSTITLIK